MTLAITYLQFELNRQVVTRFQIPVDAGARVLDFDLLVSVFQLNKPAQDDPMCG